MAAEQTEPLTPTTRRTKRPLVKRPGFLIPVLSVLGLVALLVIVAALLVPRALTAKDSLEAAIPLAAKAKTELLEGNNEAAAGTVAELAK